MPNPDLSVRRYREADLDAVIAVFQRAVRETAARDYDPVQIAAWSTVDRTRWRERRGSRPTWVAVRHGMVVGFSDLEPDGHLDMMFVDPGHQGAGIASRLLATVESAAREGGLLHLFTEASRTARPFFERRGFQLVAEQQVELRGATLTNFRMRKLL
ncbi:GNAT family N-acetyltransferase [Phreatobacter sp. AB_2022a]|uniref:GNAT family N-acetyltransferase n=1 Tax=Phreatobacter sp. AB_2022a TaxID=3003134 RepID=UPI002287378B|nr:GNAT family N-acetyltransferase [Phreatobacter sp. AB_2022a]MCZ0738327.1 GNAT family N-acetyltransferase [Phreatobacter sp. AB_2022a]